MKDKEIEAKKGLTYMGEYGMLADYDEGTEEPIHKWIKAYRDSLTGEIKLFDN